MRVFDENGEEQMVRALGQVPMFDQLKSDVLSAYDLLEQETLTTEKVFEGTYRILAPSPYVTWQQRYSKADRRETLLEMTVPAVRWLQTIYPTSVAVLIQCATIPPKKSLLWHIDSYLYHSISHKVHFPIVSNFRARYEAKNGDTERSMFFEPGNAYEINNILVHRAVNNGDTPRTHVIIDMAERAPLAEMLKENSSGHDFYFAYHLENKEREMKLIGQT